jgi:hemerythrin-like metal-binding protein
MEAYEWNVTYQVDVEILDQQHRVIFASLQKISSAVAEVANEGTVLSLTDNFNIYCKVHFFDEERVMENAGFPSVDLHRQQHDIFVNHLELFKAAYSPKKTSMKDDFINIADWFVRHVMTFDKAYADFLKSV